MTGNPVGNRRNNIILTWQGPFKVSIKMAIAVHLFNLLSTKNQCSLKLNFLYLVALANYILIRRNFRGELYHFRITNLRSLGSLSEVETPIVLIQLMSPASGDLLFSATNSSLCKVSIHKYRENIYLHLMPN